jgi:hypothetical protein
MNQKVQLFIENQEVDIFQDNSINIVSSIKDYREPDKLFTDYSQNFNLPATTRNNKIFKHYYDYDIGDGGFDARKSKEARIEINDRPFKEGYIVLESVDLKYNKPSTYKVTFFGGLRLLKELFQDLKLSDLTWLDNFNITNQGYDVSKTDTFYNYLTTSKNVTVDSTTYTQPVVVPLISNKDRLYYNSNTSYYGVLEDGNLYYDVADYPKNSKKNGVNWQNLKPAIRIDNIIRAIEKSINDNPETPSIEFSNDFFNSSNLDYYNLYMWLNKDVDEEKDIVTQRKIIDVFNNGVSRIYRTYASGSIQEQVMSIVSTDDEGNTTGQTSNKFILSGVEDESIDSVECRVSLISSNTTDKFDLQLIRDGVVVSTINQEVQTGGNSYLSFYLEQDGKYQFRLQTKSDVNINFDSGFKVQFVIRPVSDRDSFNDVTIFGGALNILANVVDFSMSENMPDMTILEFLSGIFKMFNLVCYVQSDINATYANYSANITNVKTIRVMTFDAYYASSNAELDITDKIDISSSSVHRQVPYTKIEFKYEDTEAVLAEQHLSELGQEWGGEKWEITESRAEKKYEIIPPFAHMKFERLYDENSDTLSGVQVGYSIKRSNTSKGEYKDEKYNPHYGKPVLFYPYLVQNSTTIPYLYKTNVNIYGHEPIDDYFIPLNSVDINVSQSKHFGEEVDEYRAFDAENQSNVNNLFNIYYKNYITHLFDQRSRITKLKANLTNAFLSKYSLADKIRVSGKTYSINKINVNLINGKAELELQRYYSIKSFACLSDSIEVDIEVTSAGNLYVFDNKFGAYQMGEGVYIFNDVPAAHPIAFYNFGKTNEISYTGTVVGGTKAGQDGNTYTYYSGDVTVTVNGDFGTISYECYNHGYMGGESNLSFNADCEVDSTPTPPPVTGTLTVDTTDYKVDNAIITADQTDE